MTDADTATDDAQQDAQQSGAPTVEHDWSTLADLHMSPEEIRGRLADSRKWEARAKANKDAATKLQAVEAQRAKDGMTADEKALAEAEERGRTAARSEATQSTAAAMLRMALRTGGVTADDITDLVAATNLAAFTTDDGDVDDDKLSAYAKRFTKQHEAPPVRQGPDYGIGRSGVAQQPAGSAGLAEAQKRFGKPS